MVRSRDLITVALLGMTTLAAAQSADLVAFDSHVARDFDELFNTEVTRRGIVGRLVKSTCAEKYCSYLFQSAGVMITPVSGSERLDGLTWFCGKECKSADFIIGVTASLRVLVPGLSNAAYGAWLIEAADALKGERKSISMVGPAKVTVGVYDHLGLMAFISSP